MAHGLEPQNLSPMRFSSTDLGGSPPAGGDPSGGRPVSPPPRRFDPIMGKTLLVFLVFSVGLPVLLLTILHHWISLRIGQLAIHTTLPIESIQAVSVLVATYAAARFARRPMGDYGIPPRQAFGARFWEGALWGFAMLSLVVAIQYLLGEFRITGVALSGASVLKYAAAWGLVFLCVGIYEEGFFRGFFLFALSRRLAFWRAAVVLSIAFAAAHLSNPGENAFGILQVFVIGIVFCLTIRRTGSLWFAIGLHAAWDWAQTFFYGTPDSGLIGVGHYFNSAASGARWLSGGSAGPEGSVLALAIIVLSAALVHWRFPRALYPDRPV